MGDRVINRVEILDKEIEELVNKHQEISRKIEEMKQKEVPLNNITPIGRNFYKDYAGKSWRLFFYKKNFSISETQSCDIWFIAKILSVDKSHKWSRNDEIIEEILEPWGETHKSEIKAKIDMIKREYTSPQKLQTEEELPFQPLPEKLRKWLFLNVNDIIYSKDEILIYETSTWCEKIKNKYGGYISEIHGKIEEIVNNLLNSEIEEKGKLDSILVKKDIYVKYLYRKDEKENVKELYLIDIKDNKPELLMKWEPQPSEIKRAYPWFWIAEDKLWIDMEESGETEQYLALSKEETEILLNAKPPIFINGRAGSGKSTILYYLFSGYCIEKFKENLEGEPLFLTYTQKLKNYAKNSVIKLVKSRSKILAEDNILKKSNIEDTISDYFWEFKDFLLKKIVPVTLIDKFKDKKYINFSKFKQYYTGKGIKSNSVEGRYICHLSIRNRYSPEFVWYIIRAFIRGYNEEGELTPDEFNKKVPVSKYHILGEDYKIIFEEIYRNWYKERLLNNGFWDDLSLVEFCLKRVKENSEGVQKYPVIFCDEAQDFTRKEFSLIFHLLEYFDYDISPALKRSGILPLVFAGDPFQTINPTGFRIENLGEMFYTALEENYKIKKSLNIKELSFNYRSLPYIVRLSNTIQFLRYKLLSMENLKPQEIWHQQPNGECSLYVIDSPQVLQTKLSSDIKNKVMVITPTNPKELEKKLGNQFTVLDVLNAKGLEFDQVFLYNFGEHFYNEYKIPLEYLLNNFERINPQEKIKFSYFFNKLYVGITRAKNKLHIIENENGKNFFWKYIIKDAKKVEAHVSDLLKNETKWNEEKVLFLLQSRELNHITEEQSDLEKAREIENIAASSMEPSYLFGEASRLYKSANDREGELRCMAYKLYYEQEYKKAGKKFKELFKNYSYTKNAFIYREKALESLWLAEDWQSLKDFPDKSSSGVIEIEIAKYMEKKSVTIEDLSILMKLIKRNFFNGAFKNLNELRRTESWASFCKKINNDVVSILERDDISEEYLYQFKSILKTIKDYLFLTEEEKKILIEALVKGYFKIKEWVEVKEIIEKGNAKRKFAYENTIASIESLSQKDKLTENDMNNIIDTLINNQFILKRGQIISYWDKKIKQYLYLLSENYISKLLEVKAIEDLPEVKLEYNIELCDYERLIQESELYKKLIKKIYNEPEDLKERLQFHLKERILNKISPYQFYKYLKGLNNIKILSEEDVLESIRYLFKTLIENTDEMGKKSEWKDTDKIIKEEFPSRNVTIDELRGFIIEKIVYSDITPDKVSSSMKIFITETLLNIKSKVDSRKRIHYNFSPYILRGSNSFYIGIVLEKILDDTKNDNLEMIFQFYKRVLANIKFKDKKRFIRNRMLKVKKKQAEVLNMDNAKLQRELDKIYRAPDFMDIIESKSIRDIIEEEPRYPIPPKEKVIIEGIPDWKIKKEENKYNFRIGDIDFVIWSVEKPTIQINNLKKGPVLKINVMEHQTISEDPSFKIIEETENIKKFDSHSNIITVKFKNKLMELFLSDKRKSKTKHITIKFNYLI